MTSLKTADEVRSKSTFALPSSFCRQVKTDLWEDKSPTGIEQVCIPVDLKQRNQSDMDRYGNAQQEKGEQPFFCPCPKTVSLRS